MPIAPPRPMRSKGRRSAAALLAIGILLALPDAPLAQEAEATRSDPVSRDELRNDDGQDLATSMRTDAGRAGTPYSAARDQTPYAEPFGDSQAPPTASAEPDDESDIDDPRETDEDGEDEPIAAPARRPRIDLFEAAPAARSTPSASPAAPLSAPEQGATAQRHGAAAAGAGRKPGAARGGSGEPARETEASPDAAPNDPVEASDTGRSGRYGNQSALPVGPVRSSRTQRLSGRPDLANAALRGSLPGTTDDPFAPIGTRLGTLVLFAALDQSAGYSDNLERAPNGTAGAFSDTALSTRIVSDWSRHAAELEGVANYRRNFAGDIASEPDVAIDGALRLDIDRLTTANLRGGFLFRRESGEDLDAPLVEDEERPKLFNYSASADLERGFGEAFGRGTVSAVRETTDRARRADLPGEDYDTYVASLRTGYRLSPAFAPFVEGSAGRRIFDEEDDALGLERDATLTALRGGVSFDFGEKLNGEIALGHAWNLPDADTIGTVSRPTLDAKIAWSPQRGTDIALTGVTTFEPETTSSATSTLYQAGLAARHRATARLDLNATATAGYRDGQTAADTERTWGTSAGFTYWLNRSLAVIGLAAHDEVNRVDSPGDYAVNSLKLGIRMQN